MIPDSSHIVSYPVWLDMDKLNPPMVEYLVPTSAVMNPRPFAFPYNAINDICPFILSIHLRTTEWVIKVSAAEVSCHSFNYQLSYHSTDIAAVHSKAQHKHFKRRFVSISPIFFYSAFVLFHYIDIQLCSSLSPSTPSAYDSIITKRHTMIITVISSISRPRKGARKSQLLIRTNERKAPPPTSAFCNKNSSSVSLYLCEYLSLWPVACT